MAHNPYHKLYIPGTHRGSTANPLFQGPLFSMEKRDQFKTGFNNLFGGDKNPYGSTDTPALDMEYDGSTFQPNKEFLQSDAKTGKIFGGTRAQRKEAKGLAEGGGKGVDGAALGAGLGLAGTVVDQLDQDNKYGGADVLSSGLKYAAAGAALGPIGAAVGGAVGLGLGLIQKKKFEKQQKKMKQDSLRDAEAESTVNLGRKSAAEFYQKQGAAAAGAYGVKDIDAFLEKYSRPQAM